MTTSFTLICMDKEKGKGEWRFEQHENGLNVFDPQGHLVFWFAHEQASNHLSPPSFWEDRKNIALTTDKGVVISFRPDSQAVGKVKRYLDDALLRGGHKSLNDLKLMAGCGMVLGLGIILICAAAIYLIGWVLDIPEEQGKWYARPFGFGVLGGIAVIGWSIYYLFRYRRLSRRFDEEQVDTK